MPVTDCPLGPLVLRGGVQVPPGVVAAITAALGAFLERAEAVRPGSLPGAWGSAGRREAVGEPAVCSLLDRRGRTEKSLF